ncbi:NAD(P)-dependent oxidoreductase [uncultured Eubacterium sp.]|uniref:NAD(P)-dependent oxidoreductase n=1 Tax=uncultured Eubacterium sp. TaxID=165185 RepID=UPI0015C113FB|nr:NAD(P)-dependent oxidoreductase [uncultured Eubacterium sp.]
MTTFYELSGDDKRVSFACEYLQKHGYEKVNDVNKTDFAVAGVNPVGIDECPAKRIYAGNVNGNNVIDYTKDETFAVENAFYTAEGAICIAVQNSSLSLINSSVLMVGYGRISKALHRLLSGYTPNITVCARNDSQQAIARMNGADAIGFDELNCRYDFIFNTVPHPVINERELRTCNDDTLIIDLASFPGGVDMHFAGALGVNTVVARGLPSRLSPKSAGEAVAKVIIKNKEVAL